MRCSDALRRARAARISSVASSPPHGFISVPGPSLFSTSASHSLVLDVFCFFGGPVSCFRSAAGTKPEMGCNLAAHPGKQRRPVCLCSAPQLLSSLLPSRLQHPGAALAAALGADGRERRRTAAPEKAAAAPVPLPLAHEQPPPCSQGRCLTPCPTQSLVWGLQVPADARGSGSVLRDTPVSQGMQQGNQRQGETPARRGNAGSSTPTRPCQEDCHSVSFVR